GDAEARNDVGREISAAGAEAVADRCGLKQGLPEGLNCADVGLWRACAYGDPGSRMEDMDDSAGHDLLRLDQVVDRLGVQQHQIGRCAVLDPVYGGRGPDHHHVDLVTGRALERRDQIAQDEFHRAGGHEFNVDGLDAGSRDQRTQAGDGRGESLHDAHDVLPTEFCCCLYDYTLVRRGLESLKLV